MNLEEVRHVLAAAAYDKRTPSAAEASAWAYSLGQHGITRDEAVAAVVEHASTAPGVYLEVGHVISRVKFARRRGLDNSARLEQVMLRNVTDPDDPRESINTIVRAREIAAQGGTAIPPRIAITGKFDTDAERDERTRRGAAACREVLDAIATKQQPTGEAEHDGLTPAVRAARERARTDRRTRRSDPAPIGDVLGQIRRDR
ncbi:MAG: hypothetical protein HOQ43_10820 [Glycomyces artemisiae]|uniref:Uncharacterized protein n=1 Tax=Glycomyces artemisiae TaxID=1076443 RepID=A0A850CB72_9ACTN|nr:hypothetical protein [Glycomyces artemisiae]